MSRIGNKSIKVPETVRLQIQEISGAYSLQITVIGPHGQLTRCFLPTIQVESLESDLTIKNLDGTKKGKAYHGLTRALLENMVLGVAQPFVKTILAEGVGYKFQLTNKQVSIHVGYTHPVLFEIPSSLQIKLDSPTKMTILGMDKELVGFFAAKIRDVKPPEPYKGKGLMYLGEKIRRKAGKTRK
jgi:large subunit ribosomal protein L6